MQIHRWIARDETMECADCGLIVDHEVFEDGTYPTKCEEIVCRAEDENGGQPHHLVADSHNDSSCYHCVTHYSDL